MRVCEVRMPQQTKPGERKAKSNKEGQPRVCPTKTKMRTILDSKYDSLELRARVERHSAPRRDRGGDFAATDGDARSWERIQFEHEILKGKRYVDRKL